MVPGIILQHPIQIVSTARRNGQVVEVIYGKSFWSQQLLMVKIYSTTTAFSNAPLYAGYYSIFGGSFSPKDDNEDIIVPLCEN